MLGRGKKKKEQQWLLDVRARSKLLKAVRLRMAAGALAISAGIVLVLFVCWKGGEYLLDQCVYTNPSFALDRIDIQSDGIIPREQIRAWANVREGQNLLALDLPRIKRDIELVPLIESASVERILPRQLVIRVREREPIARVIVFAKRPDDGLLEPASIYLDEQGMVIPPVLRALNTAAFDAATKFLPTVTGVSTDSFRPGHLVESPQILAALRWIRCFQNSSMARFVDVRSIDVSSDVSLLVTTEQDNQVTFAYQNFESQLARWDSVRDLARRRSCSIASLDLAVTNYVPALWAESTNAPPPVVRPAQASPYKKNRHV
jgi:cell division septal protein FtsQ